MYLSSPLYMLCNGFTKLSLLAYYIHLSPQEWFRWSVWATIGIVVTYTPVIFFLLIFACSPVAKSWDMTIQGGQCMDRPPLYIATAVTNIFTDIILFALPFRMVYGLRMCMRQKVAALFVFAVGSM